MIEKENTLEFGYIKKESPCLIREVLNFKKYVKIDVIYMIKGKIG